MCADEDCTFNTLLTQLVRVVTVLSIATLLFTSSMIMNVTFGLMTVRLFSKFYVVVLLC